MSHLIPIKRALLSVSDKTGLIPLAKTLQQYGCELISTGGTGRKLSEAGIPFVEISEVTGNPEAFGGRMKTISFQIESALLYDREKDAEEAAGLNIQAIDMVVCNLYPFKKVMEAGADHDTLIENIDIGGPTMVRSAAKNYKFVACVTSPDHYDQIIAELNENQGGLSLQSRKEMMRTAFNHTADYDSMIAMAMDKSDGLESLRMSFVGGKALRYGENSHQPALYYKDANAEASLYDMKVLHGKALSFNNILDMHGAIESVRAHEGIACSVIKHSNPCGLCVADDQREALEKAWAGDPISAFGSIIAFNRPLNLETAQFFQLDAEDRSQRKFVEVVIAPSIEADALTYLQLHKNLRVIEYDTNAARTGQDMRYMNGSLLVQAHDEDLYNKMECATSKSVDMDALKPLVTFGLQAISNIKSNSIAVVREKDGAMQLLGMGAGQPNRLVATKLALEKCKENLRNEFEGADVDSDAYLKSEIGRSVMISDAFFPFADNVELAATFGVRTIVQPGGSIRDKQVVAACDDLGIDMIMTGLRHFKH